MEKVPFGKFGFISKSVIDWMSQNVTTLAGVGVVIISALIWSIYQWNAGSPKDYLTAEATFNEWKGDRSEQLIKLQKILKQHPELHAKYDGRIAQKLLLSSEQGLASSFSKATQKRIGDLSSHYTQFSNCSLLIGEKKFQEALAQSKDLKQSLDQDENFWESKSHLVKHGAILYGYNLLRIAFLQQALGNTAEELEAWKEFQRQAGWLESEASSKSLDSDAYHLICQNFQKNDVSLKDFIQYRKQILEPIRIVERKS